MIMVDFKRVPAVRLCPPWVKTNLGSGRLRVKGIAPIAQKKFCIAAETDIARLEKHALGEIIELAKTLAAPASSA